MMAFVEPWDCLLNGATLQLEPLVPAGFRVRRKDGGAVIGEVHAQHAQRPVFLAATVARAAEGAEVLGLLRPWLHGRAMLATRLQPVAPRAAPVWRRLRHRRQGLGPAPEVDAQAWLGRLGIDTGYGAARDLEPIPEPALLWPAGHDRSGRQHWLLPAAASAWLAMRAAAEADGVRLEVVSGFRSTAYQAAIFRRKRQRGLSLEQILAVNAAPGYSEHHSGCALDLTTPGCPPAEEAFEDTAAFAWLERHAGAFGFVMSFPRDNRHGFVYEPWHWCWQG
jgi:hypothetical protein